MAEADQCIMPRLTICTAHYPEAKPFIDHYRLTQYVSDNGQSYYANSVNQDAAIRLLVTGQGQENCEFSLGRFFTHVKEPEADLWLNFGIAGSAGFSIGSIVLATALIDQQTRTRRNLSLHDGNPLPCIPGRGEVVTAASPESLYLGDYLYDMEAAAIAGQLENRGILERLVVVKLVSDGPDQPIEKGFLSRVSNLIAETSPLLVEVSNCLMDSNSKAQG